MGEPLWSHRIRSCSPLCAGVAGLSMMLLYCAVTVVHAVSLWTLQKERRPKGEERESQMAKVKRQNPLFNA